MFYLDLFKALEKHKVRYLLVGGLAMNLHGGNQRGQALTYPPKTVIDFSELAGRL